MLLGLFIILVKYMLFKTDILANGFGIEHVSPDLIYISIIGLIVTLFVIFYLGDTRYLIKDLIQNEKINIEDTIIEKILNDQHGWRMSFWGDLSKKSSIKVVKYTLKCKNKSVHVDKAVYDKFKEGENIIIQKSKYSKVILSIFNK